MSTQLLSGGTKLSGSGDFLTKEDVVIVLPFLPKTPEWEDFITIPFIC